MAGRVTLDESEGVVKRHPSGAALIPISADTGYTISVTATAHGGKAGGSICKLIPSGRTVGAVGGVGGVGVVQGGGELVLNYDSGQISAFGFGGTQIGWNGGASASVYSGMVFGLDSSNSNYSGGFTGANGGALMGGFVASSSGGLTRGAAGVVPNGQVKVAGMSAGVSLLGTPTGGATVTNYSDPVQLGKFWALAFNPLDVIGYLARQACK